jgi:hypothetical protein
LGVTQKAFCRKFGREPIVKGGGQMANKANPNDVIPLREALNMEIIINQALIDILVTKGIITQEELMTKIEQIRKEMPKATY